MGKGLEFKVYTAADPEYQERLKNLKKEPLRCDDRIEDFCRVVLHSNHLESLDNLKTAWSTLWACLRSNEGEEPSDPYVMLPHTDPLFKNRSNEAAEQQQQQQRRWQPREQHQQQTAEQQEAEMDPKPWWRRQTQQSDS